MCLGRLVLFILVGLGVLLVLSVIITIGQLLSSSSATASSSAAASPTQHHDPSLEFMMDIVRPFILGIAVGVITLLIFLNVLPDFFDD